MKTLIIAEAGSNHAGSLETAKRLIDCAVNCGANAVKFQFCSNYRKLMERRGLDKEPYPFSINPAWLPYLQGYCHAHGVELMCSTFLPEDIGIVAPYVKRFKVSAFESKDEAFIRAHALYGKLILVSGGNPFSRGEVDTLYCVSRYPCPDNEAELIHIKAHDGFSDHTKNLISGALAVALGAAIIETHFRLNDTPKECPDYEVSKTPRELADYIRNIRQAEVLLG